MRIAIFGTGGAAGYFGGRLAEAGEDVAFIARGDHLRAILAHVLQIESVHGDLTIHPARATSDPEEIGPVDAVILGVKTWQIRDAAEAMRPLIGGDTCILPLQNGVEASQDLADVLGHQHVLGGLANIISFIAGPGRLKHQGGPSSLVLGELDNSASERLMRFTSAMERAGIPVTVPENIGVALWRKFLVVTAWGGMGAVARAPIGVLRRLPETRRLLETTMQETQVLARAQGIPLAADEVALGMEFIDSLPEGGTTSLQRDIIDGRPSELEAWNGSAVHLGEKDAVPVPTHAFIYHSLLPQERRARGQEDFA